MLGVGLGVRCVCGVRDGDRERGTGIQGYRGFRDRGVRV